MLNIKITISVNSYQVKIKLSQHLFGYLCIVKLLKITFNLLIHVGVFQADYATPLLANHELLGHDPPRKIFKDSL